MSSNNKKTLAEFDSNELKNIKVQIKRSNISPTDQTQPTDYSFSSENFVMKRHNNEGTQPLFSSIFKKQENTRHSRSSSVDSKRSYKENKTYHRSPSVEIEEETNISDNETVFPTATPVLKKLERILDNFKSHGMKSSKQNSDNNSKKDNTRHSRSSSVDSKENKTYHRSTSIESNEEINVSDSEPQSLQKFPTGSPKYVLKKMERILDNFKSESTKSSKQTKKRSRCSPSPNKFNSSFDRCRKRSKYSKNQSFTADRESNYAHCSRDRNYKETQTRRKREDRSTSRSSSSDQSDYHYASKKLNDDKYKERTYHKSKYPRKHSEKYEDYPRDYKHVTVDDMKERYSRYYAVMYAFSIIMDILRQDDIYTI